MKIFKLTAVSFLAVYLLAYPGSLLASESTVDKTQASTKATLSFEQIKKAAQAGDSDAQYALGYMYYYGKNGAPKSSEEAKKWIAKAAAQKQPQAVKALALMNHQAEQTAAASATISNKKWTVERDAPEDSDSVDTVKEEQSTPSASTSAREVTAERKVSANEHWQDHRVATKNLDGHSVQESDKNLSEHSHSGNLPKYTLQLLGSFHRDLVSKAVKDKNLDRRAEIYQTVFKNKDWYVLLYGRYQTKDEADHAAKELASRFDVKPWVKPYSTVKTYKKL